MKNMGVILLGVTLAGALLAAGLESCKTRGPMPESEFLGFCNASGGHRDTCGNIGVCESYLMVVGKPQKDLPSCLDACSQVAREQNAARPFGQCTAAIQNGNDWCQRYCRSLPAQ